MYQLPDHLFSPQRGKLIFWGLSIVFMALNCFPASSSSFPFSSWMYYNFLFLLDFILLVFLPQVSFKHLKLNSYSSFKASLRCYLPSEVFLDPCCSVSNLLLFGVSLSHRMYAFLKVLVAQSRPTLCDTMDYSLPGASVHELFQARTLGVGCHSLLQGIFLTQGLNPGLLQCRQILCSVSHQGRPTGRLALKWSCSHQSPPLSQ